MTELKVLCGCGQKFKFDVEPVNGRMSFTVNCPVCGIDGTPAANAMLAQQLPAQPMPPPPPAATRMQISRPVEVATPVAAPPLIAPLPSAAIGAMVKKAPKSKGEFNLGLGTLGALLGAGIGAGIMYRLLPMGRISFSRCLVLALEC